MSGDSPDQQTPPSGDGDPAEALRERVDDPADPDPIDEHEPTPYGAPPTAVIADAAAPHAESADRHE